MKLILQECKFIEKGEESIFHRDLSGMDAEIYFAVSMDRVIGTLGAYDMKKVQDKDMYVLYPLLKGSPKLEEIDEVLNKINMNDDSDIVNREESTICMPLDNEIRNTIFWDVMNHIIIIYGKENAKKLLLMLEEGRIPRFAKFKTKEAEKEYMEEIASNVYKKSKSI